MRLPVNVTNRGYAMSDYDDVTLVDEFSEVFEPSVEHGPTPSTSAGVGSLAQVMHKYTHCSFCAGRLHFVHASDFSRNTTHEKATCPECNLDARQVLHRLQ
jgi:hypothetical protein